MSPRWCPTHPHHRFDECPVCEARIEAVEFERDHGYGGDWRTEQNRYERWLDEIGGSR